MYVAALSQILRVVILTPLLSPLSPQTHSGLLMRTRLTLSLSPETRGSKAVQDAILMVVSHFMHVLLHTNR